MIDLIGLLPKARQTGAERWIAPCPGPNHDNGDRHPSLSIRLIDGDRWLVNCFSGCRAFDVCNALGIRLGDLFADGHAHRDYQHGVDVRGKSLPRIPAAERLELIGHEVTVAFFIVNDVVNNKAISAADWQRLAQAAGRIGSARHA